MKRFCAIICSILVFFGCEKETILSVDQSSVEISDAGGSQTISLTANKPWSVSSNQSWCKVSPSAGEDATNSRITITCDPNTTYDARNCTVTFTCAELTKTVSVSQATNNGLIVSQTEYNITNAAQQLEIKVQANVKFSVEVDNGCKDWVKYNTTKGLNNSTVVLDIAENKTYDGREGKVTIKQDGGNLSSTVVIKQGQLNGLFITTPEYNISNEKHTLTVEVKSNIDFDVKSEADWIKYVETKGLKTNQIVLDISANETYDERVGKVSVKQKNGSLSGIITITQNQAYGLFISPSSFELTNEAQSIQIEVQHNVNYDVIIPASAKGWVSFPNTTTTKALETNVISLLIAENESFDQRSCEVTIKSTDNALASTVIITQQQKGYIVATEDVYEFDREGGVFTVEVNHSVDFDVEISDSWISEVSTKALITSSRSFAVEKNNSGKERTATVSFISKDKKTAQSISVHQGLITTIVTSDKYVVLNHSGGTFTININPLVDFDFNDCYYNEANEITMPLSLVSLSEPCIHVSVGKNDTDKILCADIIVLDCTTSQKDTVHLRVNPQSYKPFRREVSYEKSDYSIPVETPWRFTTELKEPVDWLSVTSSHIDDSGFLSISVDENNTDIERCATILLLFPDGTKQDEITIQQNSSVFSGDLIIKTIGDVHNIRDNKYRIIQGNVSISNIESVSDLDNYIEKISGNLSVSGLISFDGFYGLKEIGGYLYSKDRINLEGLNNLERIGRFLNIISPSFQSLKMLQSIGGDMIVRGANSLSGLDRLTTIEGGVSLIDVRTMPGLSNITRLSYIEIYGATSLEGLHNLEIVEGNASFENCDFESFEGLNKLKQIGGDLTIHAKSGYNGILISFSKLTSLSGLDNLTDIGGNFVIYAEASGPRGEALNSLSCLTGANSLKKIGGSLIIKADYGQRGSGDRGRCFDSLKSIDIPSLKEIGKDLSIITYSYYGVNLISNLSFSSLESIGGDIVSTLKEYSEESKGRITKAPSKLKQVNNINALYSFEKESDGFVSLTTISSLEGSGFGFPALTTITGDWIINGGPSIGEMKALTTVGGNLSIESTSIKSIDYLNNLTSIGNELNIIENLSLSSINGFKHLSSVKSINIKFQPSLFDFSSFVTAVKNGSSWTCSGCGYNPTKYQMLNGQANGQ